MPLRLLLKKIQQARIQKRYKKASTRAIKESNLIKRNLAFESNGRLKLSLLGKEEHSRLSQKRQPKKI